MASDKIAGYAAVFDAEYVRTPFSGGVPAVVERFAPGAFHDVERNGDLYLDIEHLGVNTLGRVSDGSLRAWTDKRGLRFELDAAAVPEYVVGGVRSGSYGCSIGFEILDEEWAMIRGEYVRTIHDCRVSHLSLTTKPAYEATRQTLKVMAADVSPWTTPTLDPRRLRLALAERIGVDDDRRAAIRGNTP